MAPNKQSGMGDNFYVGAFDLSGDINSFGRIGGGPNPLEMTDITQLGYERKGGLRNGAIEFVSYFDDQPGQAHPVLAALPRTDIIASYFRSTILGAPAASQVSKQIGYDGTRGNDGSFTLAVATQSSSFGLEWGKQHTAGKRTDVAATNGTSVDGVAATTFGFQAYLHVFSFTGTSCTVKIQESSDNAVGDPFADVVGGGFTAATAGTSQRIAAAPASLERYLRVVTVGTFSSCAFAVNIVRNETAVVF